MGSDKLTDKQRRFCEEYVIDWNATRAAIAAGYSENTAQQMGAENLTKPVIAEYIEEIQKDLAKLAGVSALKNLMTLSEIAYEQNSRDTDRIKALEVINKMLGYNAPEKHETTNTHQFSDWTEEQLRKEDERLSAKSSD